MFKDAVEKDVNEFKDYLQRYIKSADALNYCIRNSYLNKTLIDWFQIHRDFKDYLKIRFGFEIKETSDNKLA